MAPRMQTFASAVDVYIYSKPKMWGRQSSSTSHATQDPWRAQRASDLVIIIIIIIITITITIVIIIITIIVLITINY